MSMQEQIELSSSMDHETPMESVGNVRHHPHAEVDEREQMMMQQMRRAQNQRQLKRQNMKMNKDRILSKEIPHRSELELKQQRMTEKAKWMILKYNACNGQMAQKSGCSLFRVEQKKKMFEILAKTIFEMREEYKLSGQTIAPEDYVAMPLYELYNLIKNIVDDVDKQFIRILNEGDQIKARREYKDQWKQMNLNLADHENYPKRIAILSGQWTGTDLAKMPEKEFYSQSKTQYIRQKNERLLLQAQKVEVQKKVVDEDPQIEYPVLRSRPPIKQKQQKVYRYLSNETYKFLIQAVSTQQLKKINGFLTKNLARENHEPVFSIFSQLFPEMAHPQPS